MEVSLQSTNLPMYNHCINKLHRDARRWMRPQWDDTPKLLLPLIKKYVFKFRNVFVFIVNIIISYTVTVCYEKYNRHVFRLLT